jgi:hypothetical protein
MPPLGAPPGAICATSAGAAISSNIPIANAMILDEQNKLCLIFITLHSVRPRNPSCKRR